MTEFEIELVIGSLLHDVGKVIYRTGDGRSHSRSGHDYLKEEIGIERKGILEPVLYHHASAMKGARIDKDSLAYITYIADNIASAADRRKRPKSDYGFEKSFPLQPVFNILNGAKKDSYYHPMMLTEEMNAPTKRKICFEEPFYQEVKLKLTETLRALNWSREYLNSLLSVLEATLSFVPSSTAKEEVADISLYDHMKITAALASCIYAYLQYKEVTDYRECLYRGAKQFYEEKVFLLYSIDLSGIQSFLYTIHSKNALKMLRSRSFYLEIMMEHLIDSRLEALGLSRANLIYSGGGHCYMILPNLPAVRERFEEMDRETNQWLIETYDIALYMASAWVEASSYDLENIPGGSYAKLYQTLSTRLGEKKLHRYSGKEIKELNQRRHPIYSRECRVCKRLGEVDPDGLCGVCARLKAVSSAILQDPFFVILEGDEGEGLPLPGNCRMIAETEKKLRLRMTEGEGFVRAYSKNRYYTGLNVANKLWVADYSAGQTSSHPKTSAADVKNNEKNKKRAQTFEELAECSDGIKRLGVFRADVDNLGQAFVSGFAEEYNTLSRTATLSRQLSLFFKYYINQILGNGQTHIGSKGDEERNAAVIYSGGDDLFVVGAWDETLSFALDLQEVFTRYTLGTLSISGGFGAYHPKYPISRIAQETGALEESSKKLPCKNAITLFPDGIHTVESEGRPLGICDGTYSWEEFRKEVLGEKYRTIRNFFNGSEDRGKAFLYHLLELIRGRDEKINFARYVYLLSRLEPDEKAPEEQRRQYREFASSMYEWIKEERSCRQTRTAMYLYAYLTRDR